MKNYIKMCEGEHKIWESGPDKKVSVLESIFNPMLPFALMWGTFDLIIMFGGTIAADAKEQSGFIFIVLPFILLHMMPVWIYIGGVFCASIKAKNTRYLLTDRALYFQHGVFSVSTERMPLNEVVHSGIYIGIVDKFCGTGDVRIECVHGNHKISNIRDYEKVCNLLGQISYDQYSDVMYPNALRPGVNPGYNTQYRPSAGIDITKLND